MSKRSFEEQLNMAFGESIIYKVAAFLIIIGMLVGTYSANQSYAWFTDKNSSEYDLISGKVHYALELTTKSGLMVPGRDLISGVTLTNKSTIDTDVRMRIEYTIWTGTDSQNATSTTAIYATNAAINGAANVDAATDQYINLKIAESTSFSAVTVTAPESQKGVWWANTATVPAVTLDGNNVPVPTVMAAPFTALSYDGIKTGNVFANRPVTIKITLQAKQREHVEWSEITVYEEFKE